MVSRPALRAAIDRGWLIALCALIAYIALASPQLVDADGSEFCTLGAIGGRAHPSGYPFYVLWLRAWSWLPGSTPAHTAAIATALLGALAVLVLHAACRAWGARPLAATLTVAIAGAAPIVIHYHSQAEVFAMNHLVVALVLWLTAAAGPLRGVRRGAALGLVAGLGLSAHLTCVVVAPLGVLGVVRGVREAGPRAVVAAVLGLALGLAPYGYLVIADGPASWGYVRSFDDVLGFFLRREYGTTGLVPGAAVPLGASLAALATTIARSWLWLLALAGVAMLIVRLVRPAGESRWAWALLALSLALAGPVLATRFNIEPRGIGLYIVERFHLLPTLLLAIPVAAALDRPLSYLPRAGAALSVVVFVALVVAALPRLARLHSPALELGMQNLLGAVPAGGIAVVVSEDQCFAGQYLQLARGVRPDVSLVCSELLRRDWYRAAWARRGLVMPGDPGAPLGAALLRTQRPVAVSTGLDALLATYPAYPLGVLYVLASPARPLPAAGAIAAQNRALYEGFALAYPRPGHDDDFAAAAHRRYTGIWARIRDLLAAAGDAAGAREAYEIARALQPERE